MIRMTLVALLVGVFPRVARAQTKSDSLPAGVTTEMVAKGKVLFGGSGLCAACHGIEGKGSLGPDLTDSTWLHQKGTFAQIAAQILAGISQDESKSGNPMPARGGSGLDDDEVKAVAAYVWTLSQHRSR